MKTEIEKLVNEIGILSIEHISIYWLVHNGSVLHDSIECYS